VQAPGRIEAEFEGNELGAGNGLGAMSTRFISRMRTLTLYLRAFFTPSQI
jgi:hypothetical protein